MDTGNCKKTREFQKKNGDYTQTKKGLTASVVTHSNHMERGSKGVLYNNRFTKNSRSRARRGRYGQPN